MNRALAINSRRLFYFHCCAGRNSSSSSAAPRRRGAFFDRAALPILRRSSSIRGISIGWLGAPVSVLNFGIRAEHIVRRLNVQRRGHGKYVYSKRPRHAL